MTNEQITIVVEPKTMIVQDGRAAGAKLWYQAQGLDIYVFGRVCRCREHSVMYLATENTVARHIPVITLKSVREPRKTKIQPKNPSQRSMF